MSNLEAFLQSNFFSVIQTSLFKILSKEAACRKKKFTEKPFKCRLINEDFEVSY